MYWFPSIPRPYRVSVEIVDSLGDSVDYEEYSIRLELFSKWSACT